MGTGRCRKMMSYWLAPPATMPTQACSLKTLAYPFAGALTVAVQGWSVPSEKVLFQSMSLPAASEGPTFIWPIVGEAALGVAVVAGGVAGWPPPHPAPTR